MGRGWILICRKVLVLKHLTSFFSFEVLDEHKSLIEKDLCSPFFSLLLGGNLGQGVLDFEVVKTNCHLHLERMQC